ncbi:MAG: hypothetical protein R3F41_06360 [Gammaproteobacteria bacterium]|nr:hypothetical protein [Pseudomonadales bacterium]MCP5348538.1 hypothetical protein [Pseudomonadales bacterium]
MEAVTSLEISVTGELQLRVSGQPAALPRSRKTRALLAYLALEGRAVPRTELCELLWEHSEDPRAALRWRLSRLRSTVGDAPLSLLVNDGDSIRLDSAVVIDCNRIHFHLSREASLLDKDELLALERRFGGKPLDELIDAGGVVFNLWCEAASARIELLHSRLVRHLLGSGELSQPERLNLVTRRLAGNPLDDAASAAYLQELAAQRGTRAARKAFQEIVDNYRREGQPVHRLVSSWQALSRTPVTGPAPVVPFAAQAPETLPALPEKPSIAVLDFHNLGDHENGEVLAMGLTVDLNSRLARLPYFFVISRASAARFNSGSFSPLDTGRELGVRYLLSGSTQRLARRVRITVNLLDAVAGNEIWSEHYDRQLDDLFALQDEITGAVIAAIEPAIELAEARRSFLKPPENLNAWECFHRGLWHCYHFLPLENETASTMFASAIRLDPNFSRAHAGLSFTHFSRAFLNSTGDVDAEIVRAVDCGRTGVALDPRDSMAHWSLARGLFLSRQHDQALASIDQALSINPNYAQGHYARGFIGIHAGQDETALASLDSAQRLSPFDPMLFAMKSSRAISLAQQGHFDEAATWALQAALEPNAHFHIFAVAAGCLELAGRVQEAREQARVVLRSQPEFTLDVFRRSFPHRSEPVRRHFLAAMQRSGIPDTH